MAIKDMTLLTTLTAEIEKAGGRTALRYAIMAENPKLYGYANIEHFKRMSKEAQKLSDKYYYSKFEIDTIIENIDKPFRLIHKLLPDRPYYGLESKVHQIRKQYNKK